MPGMKNCVAVVSAMLMAMEKFVTTPDHAVGRKWVSAYLRLGTQRMNKVANQ